MSSITTVFFILQEINMTIDLNSGICQVYFQLFLPTAALVFTSSPNKPLLRAVFILAGSSCREEEMEDKLLNLGLKL